MTDGDDLPLGRDSERAIVRSCKEELDREEVVAALREHGLQSSQIGKTIAHLVLDARDERVRLNAVKLALEVTGTLRTQAEGSKTINATIGLRPDMKRLLRFAQRLSPGDREELFDILQGAGVEPPKDVEIVDVG